MKVLMISRKFGPLPQMSFGPFPMVYKLVKGLNEKIDIAVLSSHRGLPGKESVEGVDVYRTFFPPIDDMTKLFFMPHAFFENGFVGKFSPEVLHSQDVEGAAVFKKYKNTSMKKIFAVKSAVSFRTKNRSPDYGTKQKIYSKTLGFWEKVIIENSDYFITPVNFLKREISEHYGIDDSRFFNIKNGTFTDLFTPHVDDSKLRKKLGLGNETVFFSTSAGWRKGFDALLKSFNIIKKDCDDAKLVVAGASSLGTFEKFVDTNVVDSKEDIILVGYVSNYDFPMYYNMAKLFLFPSFMETQPNTLIESLSCGTPVVTFNSGGCPELVSKNEGAIVRVGDTEGFAEATLKLLDNKSRLRKLEANCRKRALRDYTIEKSVNEHIKMYESVLSS